MLNLEFAILTTRIDTKQALGIVIPQSAYPI
jgi:hypothetical protein